MDTVRIDKWLWAARFFKTRALAVRACDLGRILLRNQPAKPARDVHAGDVLSITNDSATWTIEVLQLTEVRGPAIAAQALYRETDDSKLLRAKADEARKLEPQFARDGDGRPSKRDRRDLTRLRGR